MGIIDEAIEKLSTKEIIPDISIVSKKVKELYYLKDRRGASEQIVKYIIKKEIIYTTRDDIKSECWIYKEGIYIPQARTYITETTRTILEEMFTPQILNEVILKIEADTYIEQDEFFKVREIYKFAVENGVVDVIEMKLLPHSPNYFFFNKLPVKYDKNADNENIRQFLKGILPSEDDLDVIQEIFGYLLIRDYPIEKAIMLNGSGRNGKSKTLELMKRFIGVDNISNIPIQSLDDESFNISELHNKLANISDDLSYTALKDTGLFKSLTGRGMISAQRKFMTRVKFTNYAKMIFCANELPLTYDRSPAFWNRWVVIDFPYTFLPQKEIELIPEDKRNNIKLQDPDIINKITSDEELSGLLNWAIEGLNILLMKKDFSYSKGVDEVKRIWFRKSSSILAFIEDMIVEEYGIGITKEHFRKVYSEYCREHKVKFVSDKVIKNVLEEQFGVSEEDFRKKEDFNNFKIRYWDGIKFKNGLISQEINKDGQIILGNKNFSWLVDRMDKKDNVF